MTTQEVWPTGKDKSVVAKYEWLVGKSCEGTVYLSCKVRVVIQSGLQSSLFQFSFLHTHTDLVSSDRVRVERLGLLTYVTNIIIGKFRGPSPERPSKDWVGIGLGCSDWEWTVWVTWMYLTLLRRRLRHSELQKLSSTEPDSSVFCFNFHSFLRES